MNVVLFTFNSPIKKTVSECESSGQSVVKRPGEVPIMMVSY